MKLLWRRVRQLESNSEIDQTKMEFFSVLVPVLLSKKIFESNIKIKDMLEMFKFMNPIGEYLYANRTALIAKVIREVDRNEIEDLNYNIITFKKYVLNVMKEKDLVDASEATKIINKYSRNKV